MTICRQKSTAVLRVLMLAMACLAATARAEVILGQHNWNLSGHPWTNLYSGVTLDTDGDPTWLKVTFPAPTTAGTTNIAYTVATNLFAGTWTTNMYVRFDFWAEDVVPTNVSLVWRSETNNTHYWGHSFALPSGINQTNTYSVGLRYNPSDWVYSGGGGDLSRYLSDLSTIDWIGVLITTDEAGEQSYGIDDVTLSIPEPPEMIMLGSAVLASLASFRRRRRNQRSVTSGQ